MNPEEEKKEEEDPEKKLQKFNPKLYDWTISDCNAKDCI